MRGLPHAPRLARAAVALVSFSLVGLMSPGCGGSDAFVDQGGGEVGLPDLGADQGPPSDQGVLADQSVTSATRGDGCVYTSLEDYLKWLSAHANRKLLSAKHWH